eukprot:CAMPEP_0170135160 /NCGR_PEP_ID=MMETSP0033_2-20121228/2333_1 /TAXON_ID=195969 /ORGANISM="Dolichomastix tenuilepis, Strain CCMP3274" /LENGTH=496 /DNA_ID=CAMNT_0010370755 /DNA_START=183 /DNA_END=1673 /DNA_ORIENTATION=-
MAATTVEAQKAQVKCAKQVVAEVRRHPTAQKYFNEPVDPSVVTDYYQVIKTPMHFDLVFQRLSKGRYKRIEPVLADISLVWKCCREYNAREEPVVKEMEELEAEFRRLWEAQNLPLEIEVDPNNPELQAVPARPPSMPDRPPPPKPKPKQPRPVVPAPAPQLPPSVALMNLPVPALVGVDDAKAQLKRAHAIIKEVIKMPDAEPFAAPVNQDEVPDYYEIVRRPCDFQTIANRLSKCRYKSPHQVWDDIEQIWHNCKMYNDNPKDPVRLIGMRLRETISAMWEDENIPKTPQPQSRQSSMGDFAMGGGGGGSKKRKAPDGSDAGWGAGVGLLPSSYGTGAGIMLPGMAGAGPLGPRHKPLTPKMQLEADLKFRQKAATDARDEVLRAEQEVEASEYALKELKEAQTLAAQRQREELRKAELDAANSFLDTLRSVPADYSPPPRALGSSTVWLAERLFGNLSPIQPMAAAPAASPVVPLSVPAAMDGLRATLDGSLW